jgi:integrase
MGKCIISLTGNQTESRASERRFKMGLYKRGQVWWVSFVYRGRRYRNSTETADRKLAQRILDKVKGEIAEGRWFERLPGEEKTFKEMMEKYLDEYASKKVSEKSFRGYSKKPISYLGDYTLSEITPKTINEYKVKRRNEGIRPATLNRELATMKRAFNLAIREWEWVKENPVARVSMEEENNKRDRWLTSEEEERLLKVCPEWLRELMIFALNTGMRLGETISLEWKGVDFFRKTVTVFKSKNKEPRTIPMNEAVFEMLKKKARVKSIRTNLVFYTQAHAMYNKTSIDHAFKTITKKAKIENLKFHDLRHTFASRLVQLGKDLYKVQRLLGHKNPSMTQRYAHHCPESLRDAVEVLDKSVTNQSQLEGHEVSKGL